MASIIVTATFSHLSGRVSVEALAEVRKALSYSRQEYGWHNGKKQFYSMPVHLHETVEGGLQFPSGLLHRVTPHLGAHSVTGACWLPGHLNTTMANGIELYADQVEAAEVALREQRGLLSLATNFGKTELIAALCASWHRAKVLVLVDQTNLVTQTATRLEAMLAESVGVMGGGQRRAIESRVVVATIQTLHRRRDSALVQRLLAETQVLLVDEVHTVSPAGWFPTLSACEGAWVRLGLSGTIREVRYPLAMEAFFGPILHEVKDDVLIAAGRSAQTTVLMPRVGHQGAASEYGHDYDLHVVSHGPRNRMLARFAACLAELGLAVLVSYYRYEHGEELERLCRAQTGQQVLRADGRTPPRISEQLQEAAATGEPGIYLVGTGYSKGLNLPGARAMINAAGWHSPLATSQRGGRIIRKKLDGGNWALIIDPRDLGIDVLKTHSEGREKTYIKKGFSVEIGSMEELLARLPELARR